MVDELRQFVFKDGSIEFIDPLYYLLNIEENKSNIAPIVKELIDSNKDLEIIVNEKYTKIKEKEPEGLNTIGGMINMLKYPPRRQQMKRQEQPTLKNFRFSRK
jgi:hypothetical protein